MFLDRIHGIFPPTANGLRAKAVDLDYPVDPVQLIFKDRNPYSVICVLVIQHSIFAFIQSL